MQKQRHSVEIDVQKFCGWDYLLDLVNRAKSFRDKALIATLFETGGRVSEVLMLKKLNFVLSNPEIILVENMPIVKRHKKVGEYIDRKGKKRWKTEKYIAYRTFPIRTGEPLVPYMKKWVLQLKLPEQLLFDLSRVRVFQIIKALDKNLYPHWFRAQRASQLTHDYGYRYRFDLDAQLDWFKWKHIETAKRYAKMGWESLAERMGIKVE